MKLKHLAFLVFISQFFSLVSMINSVARYPVGSRMQGVFHIVLSIPMIVFFFYVWKRSKE